MGGSHDFQSYLINFIAKKGTKIGHLGGSHNFQSKWINSIPILQ